MLRLLVVCGLVVFCALPQPSWSKALAPLHDPKIVAREILSNHRLYVFDVVSPQRPPGLLERTMRWARHALERFLKPIFAGARVPAELLTGTGYLILAAVLVGLMLFMMRIRLRLRSHAGASDRSSALPSLTNTAEQYAQACAAYERGDYVAAFARLFNAALSALAEAEVLTLRPAATVGEYRCAVRSSNLPVLSAFEVIAGGFTAAMYAERSIAVTDWDDAHSAYLALRQQVAH